MFKHETETPEEKVNMDYLLIDYIKDIITDMLNTRLRDQAQEPGCPYDNAYCYDSEYILANTMDAFTIDIMPKEGKTEAATQAAIVEALQQRYPGLGIAGNLRGGLGMADRMKQGAEVGK